MQVLEVPLGPMFLVITLGTFALFVQFLRRGYDYLKKWREFGREKAG
jgi:hypothetical protein